MRDDNTCWVNHLSNAWFCSYADHICFSKCLLSLLLLKELQDGATLESAHLELQDDECLVIVHFYMTPSSLSHGDLDFDQRSDLSQGGGDDAEHPMDITLSRVHLASDTCHIYFIHTKVNHLLYTHYRRMVQTRHYDQRPFDETVCDAIIANGGVKNHQKGAKRLR